MKTQSLTIDPPEYHLDPSGRFTASAMLRGLDSGEFLLELHATGNPRLSAPTTDDWVLRACLFPAMHAGRDIHIHGRIARDVLASMAELNVIWHTWRPARYPIISIRADEVVDPATVSAAAHDLHLFAYSGGVDAMATLVRHHMTDLGWRKRAIGAAMLVHGFDIPIEDEAAYRLAMQSATRVLDPLGIPMLQLRTNLRNIALDWEDACGLSLAAVASCLGSGYRGLVFSSSAQDYLTPVVPWGTNPTTDRHYGSTGFACFTDAGKMKRAEKIALVAAHPEIIRHVRVCWQQAAGGGNCGVCEKCLRTILTFHALGLEVPESLRHPGSMAALKTIRIPGDAHDFAMRNVLALAAENHIRDPWVRQLHKHLARERRRRMPSWSRRLRQLIRKQLSK